jgi:hypothetical protein
VSTGEARGGAVSRYHAVTTSSQLTLPHFTSESPAGESGSLLRSPGLVRLVPDGFVISRSSVQARAPAPTPDPLCIFTVPISTW